MDVQRVVLDITYDPDRLKAPALWKWQHVLSLTEPDTAELVGYGAPDDSPEVPESVRKAIRAVVVYNWVDEENDYEEQLRDNPEGVERHVFLALQELNEWLEATKP